MGEFIDNYFKNFESLPPVDTRIRTDGKKEISRRGELAQLDQAIINTVMKKYPSGFVPDVKEFVLEFCNDYPYRASIVEDRVIMLKMRGWK